MSKPRKPSPQHNCSFRKNERERTKREKAELKRQRRESNKCITEPLTLDVMQNGGTKVSSSDDQDASFSLTSDSEPESDADVGTESFLG